MVSDRRLFGLGLTLAGVTVAAALVDELYSKNPAAAILATVPVFIHTLSACIGVWLVFLGWPRRIGRGAYCRACGYYQESRGKLAPLCPECGYKWLWIGNACLGRPSGSLWVCSAGAVLCMLVAASLVVPAWLPSVMLRLTPNRLLLAQLASLPDRAATDQWAEFQRRRISDPELDSLAAALLRKKARDGELSLAGETVVFQAAIRPSAPALIADQYFAQLVSGDLSAPESAVAGRPVPVRARVAFTGSSSFNGIQPRIVVVSALYQGDEPEPKDRWVLSVGAEGWLGESRDLPATLELDMPGVVTLRQRFWLLIGPPGVGQVTWIGGQPIPPAGMTFRDTFEVVRDVRVFPEAPARQ